MFSFRYPYPKRKRQPEHFSVFSIYTETKLYFLLIEAHGNEGCYAHSTLTWNHARNLSPMFLCSAV